VLPEAEQALEEFFAARRLRPKPCRVSVRGKSFEGWKAPLEQYLDQLGAYQALFRSLDVRVFQGARGREGPHVYAISQLPPLDIVEAFKVGTHDASEDAWRKVQAFLARVARQHPFDVVFADPAGLEAAFHGEISREDAQRYAAGLMEEGHFSESAEVMMGQAGPPSERASDFLGQMAIGVVDFMVRKRRLRLWWD